MRSIYFIYFWLNNYNGVCIEQLKKGLKCWMFHSTAHKMIPSWEVKLVCFVVVTCFLFVSMRGIEQHVCWVHCNGAGGYKRTDLYCERYAKGRETSGCRLALQWVQLVLLIALEGSFCLKTISLLESMLTLIFHPYLLAVSTAQSACRRIFRVEGVLSTYTFLWFGFIIVAAVNGSTQTL